MKRITSSTHGTGSERQSDYEDKSSTQPTLLLLKIWLFREFLIFPNHLLINNSLNFLTVYMILLSIA